MLIASRFAHAWPAVPWPNARCHAIALPPYILVQRHIEFDSFPTDESGPPCGALAGPKKRSSPVAIFAKAAKRGGVPIRSGIRVMKDLVAMVQTVNRCAVGEAGVISQPDNRASNLLHETKEARFQHAEVISKRFGEISQSLFLRVRIELGLPRHATQIGRVFLRLSLDQPMR